MRMSGRSSLRCSASASRHARNREKERMTIQRHNVGKRLSEIVVHNGTVYLAGEVPDDTSRDITAQTEEVLGKIDRLLKQVGTDKSRLISAQIFLRDMGDFAGMNAAWEK